MLTAAGAVATLAVGVPRSIQAQVRGQQPGADAVRILIATFRSPANQGALGVDAAEAIRTRVQQENPIRQVWVLPRQDINNYLTSSGYKADSALSASDLKELAKLIEAGKHLTKEGVEEILEIRKEMNDGGKRRYSDEEILATIENPQRPHAGPHLEDECG